MGPATQRLLSFGSGQSVSVSSLGVIPGVVASAKLQVEPPQSTAVVAAVFVPPSLVLLTSTIAPGPIPVRKGNVALLNCRKTSCFPTSGALGVSSVATHWRSSIAPGLVKQATWLLEKVSPRSRETFIVTQAPERSTKNTLCVTSPTTWCESPPPTVNGGWSVNALWNGTWKVWPP